jgi:hypothetical protein
MSVSYTLATSTVLELLVVLELELLELELLLSSPHYRTYYRVAEACHSMSVYHTLPSSKVDLFLNTVHYDHNNNCHYMPNFYTLASSKVY